MQNVLKTKAVVWAKRKSDLKVRKRIENGKPPILCLQRVFFNICVKVSANLEKNLKFGGKE